MEARMIETPQRLPLSKIRRDGGTQPRAELNEEWAQEYAEQMQEGARFPAVVVFFDGSDYWLADGFHRCRGAEIGGFDDIAVDIHAGTRRDAVLHSASANAQHGHRRTNADKRRSVMMLLNDSEWSRWSDREIARKCGVSPDTVNRYRRESSLSESDSEPRTYTTRHGTVATMNTGNIGKRESEPDDLVAGEEQAISFDTEQVEALAHSPEPVEQKHVHVSANSGNNEWYTPPQYIELAREAMGGIDTDPASCELANQNVKAATYYTAETDGRNKPWKGNVWLNPPYAQPLMSEFAEAATTKRIDREFDQACILVNNATETGWFQRMMDAASAVCFIRGRVRYLDSQGNPANTPLQGQAIIYMGDRADRFKDVFSNCGRVLINE